MSLIHCPDCNTEVSSLAPACPKCGRPTPGRTSPSADVRIPTKAQTIEATGKGWKAIQLAGGVITFLGVASCCAVFGSDVTDAQREEFASNGVNFFLVGFGIWLVGKVGGWWYHG